MLLSARCVVVIYALGCREKRAKPLRFKLSSCRHLDMIILIDTTQTGKNFRLFFFLVIEVEKVIVGCACLGNGGHKGCVFMYLFASGKK